MRQVRLPIRIFRGKTSQKTGRRVSQTLQLFARLEAHGLARWNVHFFARFRIAPDAGLPRPHAEDTEFAQFDALAAPESVLECFKNGFDGLLSFCPADTRLRYDSVHDVQLDHARLRLPEVPMLEAEPQVVKLRALY